MKKTILITTFLISIYVVKAQRMSFTTFAGVANYQGELQDKKFTFQQSHPTLGIGLAYEITSHWSATASLKFGKIEGNDATSIQLARNLNFTSPVSEFQLGLEYDLFDLEERSVTPFIFGGIAVFHFNPSTIDSSGNKVALQPLGTEGQGFYLGRKKYALTQISIPMGGGFKFALNDNVRLGIEVGFRKTFTDYLDDVSTTYADRDLLIANNGALAAQVAFRGDELKTGLSYPPANTIRGNSKTKDWYYFTGVSLSFRLGTGNGNGGGKYKTGCPINVR